MAIYSQLFLRNTTSPYGDLTRNSVLSFKDLDQNFIFLKERDITNINYSSNTLTIETLGGNSFTTTIVNSDTFVTGGTYNPSTVSLDFTGNSGFTPFNVDVSSLTDTYVSGGVYDPNTGCVTFSTTSGYTFDVCGFVTGFTQYWTSGSTGTGSIKVVNGGTSDSEGDYSLVSGYNNLVGTAGILGTSKYSSIIGGSGNTIDRSDYSSIIGGSDNDITKGSKNVSIFSSFNSNIDGSCQNSVILGGGTNTLDDAVDSVIIGGTGNTLEYLTKSVIIGGDDNEIGATEKSAIIGGNSNRITSKGGVGNSVIAGGEDNTISLVGPISDGTFIGGGRNNLINFNSSGDTHSSIIGGYSNYIYSTRNGHILGGVDGEIGDSDYSSIIGGSGNTIQLSVRSGIFNGLNNTLNGDGGNLLIYNSNILGGEDNTISNAQSNSSIIGGSGNTIDGYYSGSNIRGKDNGILGGVGNDIIYVNRNAIIAGTNNLIGAESGTMNSVIAGGKDNTIFFSVGRGDGSFIGGGHSNTISGYVAGDIPIISSIIGGSGNTIDDLSNVHIIGCKDVTGTTEDTVYVPNLNIGTLGGGVSVNNLGIDASGNVVVGSSGNTYWTEQNGGLKDVNGSHTISGTSTLSIIAGGAANNISDSDYSSIIAGYNNYMTGTTNVDKFVMVGGWNNTSILNRWGGMFGGINNGMTGTTDASVIIGGGGNKITSLGGASAASSIVGGINNLINSDNSFIGGGRNNTIEGIGIASAESSIVGGVNNIISGASRSVILGGDDNEISSGSYTSILGGQSNTVSGTHSAIIGGGENTVTGDRSVTIGGAGLITNSEDDTVMVPDLNVQGTLYVNRQIYTKVTTGTTTSNSFTYDCNQGMTQVLDLEGSTGTATISISNSRDGSTYTFYVIQGSGGYDVSFGSGKYWLNDTAPFDFTTLADNEVALVTIQYVAMVGYVLSAKKLTLV